MSCLFVCYFLCVFPLCGLCNCLMAVVPAYGEYGIEWFICVNVTLIAICPCTYDAER